MSSLSFLMSSLSFALFLSSMSLSSSLSSSSSSIPGGAKSSQKVHAGPQLDEKLFENIRHTGINFDKYDNIAVKVEGHNPPKPVQSIEEAGLNAALANNVAKSG